MTSHARSLHIRSAHKRGRQTRSLIIIFLGLGLGQWLNFAARADVPPSPAQASEAPAATIPKPDEAVTPTPPAETMDASASPATLSEPDLKPRFRMHVASIHQLVGELLRSHSGTLVREVAGIMLDSLSRSAEGLDHEETLAVIDTIRAWPDSSAELFTFAPDIQGRSRWALRLDWPVTDLRSRLQTLLESETARDMLSGVRLRVSDEVAELRLRSTTLGYVLPADGGRSMFSTHADLSLPAHKPKKDAAAKDDADSKPLLTARLALAGTEKDSGATAFSSFSVITAIEYTGRVNADGAWREKLDILWPPISGMGLKAFFGKVKQTFFVPETAFGAVALNAGALPGILDQMAGFGAQVEVDSAGKISVAGEAMVGPLTAHGHSELGVVVLPGTGFLPAPDFVIQSRIKKKDSAVADVRKAIDALNKTAREREAREEWREIEVGDRPVFWRDSAANARGLLPFAMKSVVFTTSERDAKGAEKDFLIMAWTTTSPEVLVRRWLAFPRTAGARYVPATAKTSGEVWVNWKDVYRLVHPYVDLMLNVGASGALLPHADRVSTHLTPGRLTAQVKYAGLNVSHEGPLPVGVLALPLMFGISLEPDTSGTSDLAREQFAVQRLQVLYHHAKLFRKDLQRWPAELQELDGYVDFAAHPELLELQLSAGKEWSEWFESFSEEEKKDEEEEDDEIDADFNDDLYVIDWKKDRWSLGYAPDTFEHLQRLAIDQDGVIQRVAAPPKPVETKPVESKAVEEKVEETSKPDSAEAPAELEKEGDDDSPKE